MKRKKVLYLGFAREFSQFSAICFGEIEETDNVVFLPAYYLQGAREMMADHPDVAAVVINLYEPLDWGETFLLDLKGSSFTGPVLATSGYRHDGERLVREGLCGGWCQHYDVCCRKLKELLRGQQATRSE